MKTKTKMNLVEGAVVGAALGIAAGIVLAPESGKKFRTDIKKKSAEFHAYLAPRFKVLKKVGEEEYDSLVKNAIKTYGKAKRLSESEGKDLVTHAKKSWKQIKKHAK